MRERFPEAYPLLESVLEEVDPSRQDDYSCVVAEVLTLLGVRVVHSEAVIRPWVWLVVKQSARMCFGEEAPDDLVRGVSTELARRGSHSVVERENLPVRITPPHDRVVAGVLRRRFPSAYADLAASGDDLDAAIDALMLRWHRQQFGEVSGGAVAAP